MPRTYEAVYIFDSALEDDAIADKLARHHGLLKIAEEPSIEHWGRRQLAYPIKKRENGYYAIARFTLFTMVATGVPSFSKGSAQ